MLTCSRRKYCLSNIRRANIHWERVFESGAPEPSKLWRGVGLTLSFLSWSKFPVFPYKRGYVKGNQRDVRGTVIIDICHNTYEDLLKMIFPFFNFSCAWICWNTLLFMKTGYPSKSINQFYLPSTISILVSYFFPRRSQFWFNICGLSFLKS